MKILILFFIAFFLLSCAKEESTINKQIDFDAAPPPAQGTANRAIIMHYEGLAVYGFPVPEKNLTLLLGFGIRDFCNGDFSNVDVFDLHDVVKDEGDDIPRIHQISRGDNVLLEIWPFADLELGANCQPYFDHAPIFSDRVDVMGVDNDVAPYDSDDNKNINTFGFIAGSDKISVVLRGAWDGFNDDTWRTMVCKIKYN